MCSALIIMACLLSVVLISILAFAVLAVDVTSVPRDAKSLMALKRSFSDFPLEDWSDGNLSHFCNWTGVTCDRSNQRVVALNLQNKSISGSLPACLADFKHLTALNLSFNFLTGQIPNSALGSCSSLVSLSLARNNLTGTLPVLLSNCTALNILDLSYNNIGGPIIGSLSKLPNLQQLNLLQNNFRGPIPGSLSNCTSLVLLNLCLNYLIDGTIPPQIGLLTRLQYLCLSFNNLSGSIPDTIASNLTQLRILGIGFNSIGGPIPALLGKMPYLEQLWLDNSLYEGPIPPELGNISTLQRLMIYNNSLTGKIPKSLGQLFRLTILSASYNHLTGSLPTELGNLTNLQVAKVRFNKLSGSIPAEFGRVNSLTQFAAEYNGLSGKIPIELGNCSAMERLSLQVNRLSGTIPPELGRLFRLGELQLDNNQLTGRIPVSLSNCTNLQNLSLGYNLLQGNIPPAVASLRNIVGYFSVPHNRLTGQIPSEIGGMKTVTVIDLAGNLLSGKIPESLGSCVQLLQLNLSNNQFSGEIPRSLGSLITLTDLDLSVNNLSGRVPNYLANMASLSSLNVSYNRLSGPIPSLGVFRNLSSSFFSGNLDLCGPILGTECLQSAPQSSGGLSNGSKFGIIVGSFAVGALVLTALVYIYVYRRKKFSSRRNEQYPQQSLFIEREIVTLSPEDLYNATAGFSDDNIIGSGKMATVYGGMLNIKGKEKDVAVKRFKEDFHDSIVLDDSMTAELRVLAMAKHRNLVQLLGYCLASKTKALVMEMKANRTLAWHIEEQTLEWENCVRIARGVAEGLMYLHHECPQPILHCDLKPSNILLDMEFEPSIADFGISRLLKYEDMSRGLSTSNLKGSIGYMPPEYAYSGRMTAKADVYGYGIVILEMISGKNPTSEMFSEENSLPKWALRAAIEGAPLQVVAPLLLVLDGGSPQSKQQMIDMVKLGLACTSPIPENRPTMKNVVRMLDKIDFARTEIRLPSTMTLTM